MRLAHRWLIALALLFAALPVWGQAGGCPQTVCWVATTGNDVSGTGSSASPFRTIQHAIEQSVANDTIRVRPGTYNECPSAFFVDLDTGAPIPSDLTILADDYETAQRNATTIIDGLGVCDADAVTPAPALTLGHNTTVRGFTIKNGGQSGIYALGHVTITKNVIDGNFAPVTGGGITLYTSSYVVDPDSTARIDGNTIRNNVAGEYGGGVFVWGEGVDGIASDVVITTNVISGNSVGTIGSYSLGGGIAAYTNAIYPGDASKIVISTNTIDGNTAFAASGGYASYGGGVAVVTYGNGQETVEIKDNNTIRNNVAEGYGGGVSATAWPYPDGEHHIDVRSNPVSANEATNAGGGLYLYLIGQDLPGTAIVRVHAEDNDVTGNSTSAPPSIFNFGGGGICAVVDNLRTDATGVRLTVERNTLASNTTGSYGGGASLLAFTFSQDPAAGGDIIPTSGTLRFANNLVNGNAAFATPPAFADGGGVYAYGYAFGDAHSEIEATFNTLAANLVDADGAGGIALDAQTTSDGGGNFGTATLEASNSIVVGNEGDGIGGPIVPGVNGVAVDISYNDVFGNDIPYGPNVGNQTDVNGNIDDDPALSTLFVPPLCSVTIDAADPDEGIVPPEFIIPDCMSNDDENCEYQPNGGRANMGHLGLTPGAVRTFPDITGDGRVDGIDVLRVATSFGALSSEPARFLEAADRDKNGQIDGKDLSYVSAFFGTACP